MSIRINIFIGLLLFSWFTAQSQEFGTAIVLNKTDLDAVHGDMYAKAIHKSFSESGGNDFTYYTWKKGDDKPERYSTLDDGSIADKPITAIGYIESKLTGFDKFSLASSVDTTGKVTGYFLRLNQSIAPQFKTIDLATGEVINSGTGTRLSEIPKGGNIQIKNYTTITKSKTRPEKLKKDTYNKYLAAVKKSYKNDIAKVHKETVDKAVESIASVSRTLIGRTDTRLWSVKEGSTGDDKKVKSFWIDATAAENVRKDELLSVYAKRNYGELEVYDELTIAGVVIEEVTEDGAKVKTNLFNRKKITNAFEEGLDIVLARNPKLVRSINVDVDSYKRVQVKGDCIFCNSFLETSLAKIPNVILIERQLDPVRDYFVGQYTDEKFIDFDMSKVQGKAEGADYIFETTSSGLQATEVATSRIEKVDKKKAKGFVGSLFSGGVSSADIINLSLNILDLKIELLEITKSKKGKAKQVQLYSPMGFASSWKVKVVREIEEQVGGRSIVRHEEIGTLSGRNAKTSSIKNYKVKSGEKEIYQAKESGIELKYIIEN